MSYKYETTFLKSATVFDNIMQTDGEAEECVRKIIDSHDNVSVLELHHLIREALKKSDENKIKAAKALKEALLIYLAYLKMEEIAEQCSAEKDDDNRTLSELMTELNGLVGLGTVKQKVADLIAYQKVQKERELLGLRSAKSTLHLAFTGNPGTGKTTVARIVGRVYKQIGLLSKGHFIEVSRTDLIAGYQGQTALKVKEVITKAKGGVLFIDEAYSITENDHSDSYGRECLTELTKALEDYRDDLVVIVAGYTEPMKKFFESNPGLKSRFNTFIEFDDYSETELNDILQTMCRNNCYALSESAESIIKAFFAESIAKKDDNFANGRLVRNLYEDLVMNHARRVAKLENPDRNALMQIVEQDVELTKQQYA